MAATKKKTSGPKPKNPALYARVKAAAKKKFEFVCCRIILRLSIRHSYLQLSPSRPSGCDEHNLHGNSIFKQRKGLCSGSAAVLALQEKWRKESYLFVLLECSFCYHSQKSELVCTRLKVREMFGLHGNVCRDILVGFCCYCCALGEYPALRVECVSLSLVQLRVQMTGEH